MASVGYDKKEALNYWNKCKFELDNYNQVIQEKMDHLDSVIKESKRDVANRFAKQPYSDNIKLDMKVNSNLQQKITQLEKEKEQLTTQIITDKKIHELEKSNMELKTKLTYHSETLQEVKQEKALLTKKADSKEESSFVMMKKYYLTIAITGLIIGGFVGVFSFYENSIEKDPIMLVGEHAKSKYLIQNLRGDTLKTWFPWMLIGSQALHVNILDNNLVTPERMDAIKKVIVSDKVKKYTKE